MPAAVRRTAAVAAALATVVASSSCYVEARQQRAVRLIRSAKLAMEQGTAKGELVGLVKIVRIQGVTAGARPAPGSTTTPQQKEMAREQESPPFGLDLDLAHRRAAVIFRSSAARPRTITTAAPSTPGSTPPTTAPLAVLQGGDHPIYVFDRWAQYLYAPPDAAKDQSANQAGGGDEGDDAEFVRSWVVLDWAAIDAKTHGRLRSPSSMMALSPWLMVQMLRGTLTGSVRNLGTETVAGVPTTHYTFNVDREKATQGMPDKERQIVQRIFERDDLRGTVFKHAEVWLDAKGLPRQILLRFTQKVDLDNEIKLGFRLRLTDYGTPVSINVPKPDVTTQVIDFPQLVGSLRGPS